MILNTTFDALLQYAEQRLCGVSGHMSCEGTPCEVVREYPPERYDFFCPRGFEHRVIGGTVGTAFLEISFGDFDEDNINRIEDRYGRA